jgi:hypothetical protein
MSDGPTQSAPGWPAPRSLARELGLAVLALIGVAVVAAAAMIGLILLLYAPR